MVGRHPSIPTFMVSEPIGYIKGDYMRLWHQLLIEKLPRNQLSGQHRECCALRGNGWGKKHRIVDYVFTHSPYMLYEYHLLIMAEMTKRGYNIDKLWFSSLYRGKICNPYTYEELDYEIHDRIIYKEHNTEYLKECLANLLAKCISFD
jgi:uncharacterized protein (TIGR02328 family)